MKLTIDEEEFSGTRTFYNDSLAQPAFRRFWNENKHQFPATFVREIDARIGGDA